MLCTTFAERRGLKAQIRAVGWNGGCASGVSWPGYDAAAAYRVYASHPSSVSRAGLAIAPARAVGVKHFAFNASVIIDSSQEWTKSTPYELATACVGAKSLLSFNKVPEL